MAGKLSHTLQDFIQTCIPTYQAAELLLFFAANPDCEFSTEEIVARMRPKIITVPVVREYADLFTAKRLTTKTNGRFRYGPSSSDLERAVGELVQAYNEQPVTLIVAIYSVAESRIQSFADSVKWRKG